LLTNQNDKDKVIEQIVDIDLQNVDYKLIELLDSLFTNRRINIK